MELCGGAARVSQVCIRRKLHTGGNWDIITDCDLNDPKVQMECLKYIDMVKPLVIVMAPTCTPFGPWANLNYHLNYEAWHASYLLAAPHGRFCGHVALKQILEGRFFINEQPDPSWLYQEEPWPRVMQHPSVDKLVIHQCMTGQKASCGLPAKKPTGLVSNSTLLLKPSRKFKCDNTHQHADLQGGKASPLKLWTWQLATALADGIGLLIRALRNNQDPNPVFPVAATNTDPNDQAPDDAMPLGSLAGKKAWRLCKGCLHRAAADSPLHSRAPGIC